MNNSLSTSSLSNKKMRDINKNLATNTEKQEKEQEKITETQKKLEINKKTFDETIFKIKVF